MVKRIEFICVDCGEPSNKTKPNYYKQLKRIGRSLCQKCAIKIGKDKIAQIINDKHQIKSNTKILLQCRCGNSRLVQDRQRRNNSQCPKCAAVINYNNNKSIYHTLAQNRINNNRFSKSVSSGMLSVPSCVRSQRSKHALITRWADTDLRRDEFISKASILHHNKYDYSRIDYVNILTPVTIICPLHGEFQQTPSVHLKSTGCKRCFELRSISLGHQRLADIISELGISVVHNDRNIIKPYELDIWIPQFKLGIEHHGVYWHSYDRHEKPHEKLLHKSKADFANVHDIQLLQFFENECILSPHIIKSMIYARLHHTSRIYARQCEVIELTQDTFNQFMTANHLQGGRNCSFKVGLVYNGVIVAAIGVSRHHRFSYELIRYASQCGVTVVGGLSKLLNVARISLHMSQIMTYADRRYSRALSYQKVGFKIISVTKPNYYYTTGDKNEPLLSRQQFQKCKLPSLLQYYSHLDSESTNMFNNGYRRIWDAGHIKLLKKW